MGKFIVELTDEARKHLLQYKKSGNKPTLKKIETIIEE